MSTEPTPCPQAWHGGLPAGLLVECRHEAGHRGWHRDKAGTMQWGGKLTAAEHALAAKLRTAAAEVADDEPGRCAACGAVCDDEECDCPDACPIPAARSNR